MFFPLYYFSTFFSIVKSDIEYGKNNIFKCDGYMKS